MNSIYKLFKSFHIGRLAALSVVLNTRTDEIPMCFRKSIKSLKKLRKYVLNSLKYDYTSAMVDGKNNKIKVIKRVSLTCLALLSRAVLCGIYRPQYWHLEKPSWQDQYMAYACL